MVKIENTYSKTILNEIIMPIFAFENCQVVWVNRRGKEFLHIKDVSELKEKCLLNYLDKNQCDGKGLDEVASKIKDAFNEDGAEKDFNIAIKIKGMRIETHIKVVPLKGKHTNSGIILFDRSRRKGDVLVRRKTEDFYRDLFEQVSVPIAICDSENRVVEINEAFHRAFGYSRQEAVDKYSYDLIALPSEKMHCMNVCNEIKTSGIKKEKMNLVDKWGNVIEVNFTGHPILENGQVVGTYRIYEDLKLENDLKNGLAIQKAYFEGLFNASTEALVLLDKNDKVVYFNEAFENLFGFKLTDSRGKPINDIVALGEKRGEAESISKKTLNSISTSMKTIRYHKDGSPIPIELIVKPVTKEGDLLGIYAVYKDLTQESRMKKEIEIRSEYFKQLFGNSIDAMALLDPNQRVMDTNNAFAELFSFTPEECKNKDINSLIVTKDYLDESDKLMNDTLKGRSVSKATKRLDKYGQLIDVEASGNAIVIDGKIIGTLVSYRDIRIQKHMMDVLDEQKAYFKQLFDNSPLGIVMIDTLDRVVDVNKGFCSMFGYEKVEAKGRPINDLIAPDSHLNEAVRLSSELIGGGVVKFETKRKNKSGDLIDVDILAYPVWLNEKQVGGYAIYSDITEEKRAEKEIEFLAYRDSLTGLFNRKIFYDKLREKIRELRQGEKLAVCYIDLDGFKKVNDSMGHNVGDELLRYVAKNIEDSMGKDDIVARMGGDEFVIFTECVNHEKIGEKMDKIIERLNRGLRIFDYKIKISLSIGVAIYPDHGNNVEEIIKKADTAMYIAKKDGFSGYLIFTSEMDFDTNYRDDMENRLKMALSNGEIEMHYQPILSIEGYVRGFEALMRWENPVFGKVSPEVFIPIAEDTGEIHQLGRFALNQSTIVLKKWREVYGEDFFMSVNLSVKQLERANIADSIIEITKKNGVRCQNIHIEITESCSTENIVGLNEKLSKLKEAGFSISIDDFGTGYSSFRQLRDTNVDFVKIDRSFVKNIDKRLDNNAIVKAIVAMGKSLGVELIAEGVETESEYETMKGLGCDMYQGYLMLKPNSEKNIEAFIEKKLKID